VRVRKRDGHEESFDELRLQDALARALRAGGADDVWARQFRECVLLQCGDREVADAAVLAEACDAVLRRFGCADAADAYRAYRDAERTARAALRVHVPEAGGPRSAPWDRARLQLTLQRDRYLERAVARLVARRVERRLVSMGQRHVTGRLVAALSDNECRVLGLAHGAVGAERIGPERRHLRAWLGGDCLPAEGVPAVGPEQADVRPLLGAELLAAFAVEELLPSSAVDARDAGRIEFLGLGEWLRPLVMRVRPHEGEAAEAFWTRVGEAAGRAAEVQVEVHRADGDGLHAEAPRWLARGGARLRLQTDDPGLALAWAEAGLWPALGAQGWDAADAAQRAALAACGQATLRWSPRAATQRGELLHGAAAVNLARAAADAGAWGEREFLEQASESARAAAGGLAKLLERACAGARPHAQLLPAGLADALRTLFPEPAALESRTRPLMLALRERFEIALRRAGLRADPGRPPRADGVGTRLADRDGLPGAPSLALGWQSAPLPFAASVRAGLAAAPWLEFPLDQVHGAPWAELLRPRPAARGR